jgi:hypothetical protein
MPPHVLFWDVSSHTPRSMLDAAAYLFSFSGSSFFLFLFHSLLTASLLSHYGDPSCSPLCRVSHLSCCPRCTALLCRPLSRHIAHITLPHHHIALALDVSPSPLSSCPCCAALLLHPCHVACTSIALPSPSSCCPRLPASLSGSLHGARLVLDLRQK